MVATDGLRHATVIVDPFDAWALRASFFWKVKVLNLP